MRTYIAIVHKDPDSCYGVHFPDVPGCFSAAKHADGILAQAAEALALHLEGEELPKARGIDDLRKDPETTAALADGAFLIAVPFIENAGRTVRTNITMTSGLLQAIDATAKQRGLTRSAFMAEAARREILVRN